MDIEETKNISNQTFFSESYPSTFFEESLSEYPSTDFGESYTETIATLEDCCQLTSHERSPQTNTQSSLSETWCSTPASSDKVLPRLYSADSPVTGDGESRHIFIRSLHTVFEKSIKGDPSTHVRDKNNAISADENVENFDPHTSGKSRKMSRSVALSSLMYQLCCQNECMRHITASNLEQCQGVMKSMTEVAQKQYILDQIALHKKVSWRGSKYKTEGSLVVSGRRVCDKAWCELHSVSMYRFRDCLRRFVYGQVNVVHGNTNKRKKMEKTTSAIGWMNFFFSRVGDYMPHKTQVHLPVSYTKKALYEKMVREFKDQGTVHDMIISYQHFTSVWQSNFPEIIIPKVSEFTKCSTCTELDEALEKGGSNDYRNNIRKLRDKHLALVEAERVQYHHARECARRESKEVTTIIIDGMDQSKTSLPHFTTSDKNTKQLAFLPVHVTGVLIHTSVPSGKIPVVFLDYKEVPHDSNMTANILLRALERAGDKLGKTLFLQLDNCYRENKNRYILSLCSLLVDLDVFIEVTVHFLPVGHTHEDIDQLFRCIAGSLRKQNAYTVEDLTTIIRDSYTPPIEVNECGFLYDVKEWIRPHFLGPFGNHSRPHWFRFTKINGKARMHYKLWYGSQWEPSSETERDGLLCLATIPNVQVPPEWVKPSFERVDLDGLRKDIPCGYKGRFNSPDQIHFWKKFLESVTDREKVPEVPVGWSLQRLAGRCRTKGDEQIALPANIVEIEAQLAAKIQPVYIGRQGRAPRISEVVEVDECHISVGMLVAVNLENNEYTPPYIGKVLTIDNNMLNVHWMRGGYNKEWTLWNVRSGRSFVPYTDYVHIDSILLYDFMLTAKGGRLKKATIEALKEKYDQL